MATRYDWLNHVFSLGLDFLWRRRAAAAVAPAVAGPLLDGATGSADLALELARRYPDRQVAGVDFSTGMLRMAQRKIERRADGRRIELIKGDLTHLNFESQSFAGATVAFGIRNVPDRPAALAELRRVLRPGGRLVILEFAMPTLPVFAGLYRWYFGKAMPAVSKWAGAGDAYSYLFESVSQFPLPAEFCRQLKAAGLGAVEFQSMTWGTATLYQGVVER